MGIPELLVAVAASVAVADAVPAVSAVVAAAPTAVSVDFMAGITLKDGQGVCHVSFAVGAGAGASETAALPLFLASSFGLPKRAQFVFLRYAALPLLLLSVLLLLVHACMA